jgi:poly-gamma-glutamate capsule biosynthesis protein CapA/YwtB (metallophosphatase superfamily)
MAKSSSEKNAQVKADTSGSDTAAPKRKKSRKGTLKMLILIAALLLGSAGWLYVRKNGYPDIDTIKAFFTGQFQDEEETVPTLSVCIGNDVSELVIDTVGTWTASESLSGTEVSTARFAGAPERSCDVVVASKDHGDYDLVFRNYYVVIRNKKNPVTHITENEISQLLGQGTGSVAIGRENGGSEDPVPTESAEVTLAVSKDAFDPIDRSMGIGVSVKEADSVVSLVESDATILGIIPFGQLTYTVDTIPIDGTSLLSSEDISGYSLVEEVWVDEGEADGLFAELQEALGSGNFRQENMRTVVMTGTSVVGARGHYQQSVAVDDWMNAVRDVGDILRKADVAHISNEASFVPDCIQNNWTMVFCGPPESFELLTWAGIDVVGLTGNHILDFGDQHFLDTLGRYEDAGISYFGGGRDYTDAHTAAVKELGPVKIAFLGYNMIPPVSSFATGDSPGSAELQISAIQEDITAVSDDVDYVFVDMQWGNEYEHEPNSYQIEYGHAAIDAGADIVNGVHPHWVQPVKYYNGGLIFYSLGNFIFDQLWSLETREGVMVRHYFYENVYIGYELIPTILSTDLKVERVTGEDAARITGYVLDGIE